MCLLFPRLALLFGIVAVFLVPVRGAFLRHRSRGARILIVGNVVAAGAAAMACSFGFPREVGDAVAIGFPILYSPETITTWDPRLLANFVLGFGILALPLATVSAVARRRRAGTPEPG